MKPLEWIIIIVIAAGIILLQIYLSRKENKWLGLILPLVALCASIFAIFVTPVYMIDSSLSTVIEQSVSPNGDVIENVITNVPQQSEPGIVSAILMLIGFFALYNIPTAVLLIIYAACRVKRKRDAELEKMNIQDL